MLLLVGGLLLACAAPMALPVARGPRWACPSPEPAAWGAQGPPKRTWRECRVDPLTGARECVDRREDYAEWEQEYGDGGSLLGGRPAFSGPPYPSPTPYGRQGNSYSFGQRVEIAPMHVRVAAGAGDLRGARQIYLIDVTWDNPTGREQPITYASQLWLRSIVRPDGAIQSGDGWGIDLRLAEQLGLAVPASIPPGESAVRLPVLAPPGRPLVAELHLPIVDRAAQPEPAGAATATPNAGLRAPQQRLLTVQWVDALPTGPACDDPGALTDWSSDERKAIPRDAMVDLRAPPGAPRVVQIALAQAGKRYVWGAEGPESFDCSGLMQWSYQQIGIRIPRTTATQWPQMRPVDLGRLQAGDLVFMDTREGARAPLRVTHVGMVADLDGDGRWDLIHAASPRLGVRVEYDVFGSAYYAPRIFSEGRTAR